MSNGKRNLFRSLLKDIKKKKELSSLDNVFVKSIVNTCIKENPKILRKKLNKKSKEYKNLVKEARRRLRIVYGIYHFDSKRGNQLLNKLKLFLDENVGFMETYYELLSLHKSTKERLGSYPLVYQKIFRITGEPKSVLDLGSGLNPLSFTYMGLDELDYTAVELSKKEVAFLNNYFKLMKGFGLKGKAIKMDLLNLNNYKKLKKVDICFMFKVLESLEFIERDITKKILKLIPAKYIVVSFSTRSLSGELIRKKGRKWFRNLVKGFKAFNAGDELFYIIKK